MNYEREFLKVYGNRGLTGYQGRKLSLHRSCCNRKACWLNLPTGRRKYGGIIRPYVGSRYEETRLVVLAINNRINVDPVCFDSERHLICHYAADIMDGKKPKPYYFASVWAGILLKMGRKPDELGDILENQIAWIQAVKCNPEDTQFNEPYPQMLKRCPSHILRYEIQVLNPKCILVLGRGLSDHVLPVIENCTGKRLLAVGRQTQEPRVERWRLDDNTNDLRVVVVPHPSARSLQGQLKIVSAKLKYLQMS